MRLPGNTHRIAIIGRTGSGKTQAAAWFLSRASIDTMPWVVLDYKRDALLNSIRANVMKITASIPNKPGVNLVQPLPKTDDEAVTDLLWRIWKRGDTGLYIDEGYMIGDDNPAFRALLTQGRSKNIPMICLSQRPFYMDRFAFSEADFYLVFALNDRKDQQRVGEFLHRGIDLQAAIPRFTAWYHDVAENQYSLLRPVPSADLIRQTFRARIGYQKRLL